MKMSTKPHKISKHCFATAFFVSFFFAQHGRGLLVNGSTTFNSHVEYECLHDKMLIGASLRICQANATWSGREPSCIDRELDRANDVDTLRIIPHYDEHTSSSIGISLAIGGLLLVAVLVGAAWIWMKHKPSPPVNMYVVHFNLLLNTHTHPIEAKYYHIE